MIPFRRVAEPAGFAAKVSKPGNEWLQLNPMSKRPKALWTPYTAALSEGFGDLCGYAAMHDPTGGTVDHFLSYDRRRDLAYDWSNYRFASATLNSSKKNADDTVLDPYEVGDGWFEIILPSLQMQVTEAVPTEFKDKAKYTLTRLKLRDGERIIRWRKSWYDMYLNGQLSLGGLRRVAPLLAAAVETQNVVADNPKRPGGRRKPKIS